MEPETIILIITNIAVPITVAIITAIAQSKKYKKEIALINVQHENRVKEIVKDYEHQIEILNLQFQQQKELETQKVGNAIVEKLTDKLSDEIIHQPSTQKMINQKTTRAFLGKKGKRR